MGHVLFEVVDAYKEVGIASLQAICVEELLNQLDVAHVCLLTLHLHTNGVIEGGQQTI